jgi:putative membrane protein
MRFVIWLAVNALALLVAIWLFHGITLHTHGDRTKGFLELLVCAAILGVVNSLVKPVVQFFSIPLIILTLGLLLLVINALMLLLTSRIAEGIGLAFRVHGFWTAVFGSIVISLAGMVIEAVLPDRRR